MILVIIYTIIYIYAQHEAHFVPLTQILKIDVTSRPLQCAFIGFHVNLR